MPNVHFDYVKEIAILQEKKTDIQEVTSISKSGSNIH